MGNERSKQGSVGRLVKGTVLLLLGVLGSAAGCSAEGDGQESLGREAQSQLLCNCPADNPCATFQCDAFGKCIASPKLKEGDICGGVKPFPRGVCYLNLCCPGCVIPARRGTPPMCAPSSGTENAACGTAGTLCEDCTTDACQIPACDGRSCNLKPVDEGGACVGTTGFCTKGACCKGCVDETGACQPGNTLTACGISQGSALRCSDCSDELPCTADACIEGRCSAEAVAPGTSCDDGNICNGVSNCSGKLCVAGDPLVCDDGDPCTKDTCDAQGGCKRVPDPGKDCNDGDACTTGEKCDDNGKCGGGVVSKCDDNLPCTNDSCEAGKCVNQPKAPGTICNDGNACTDSDKCNDAGKCVGTGGPTCEDDQPCTKNTCLNDICSNPFEPATTPCIRTDSKCFDASHCSGTDESCVGGTPKDCNDGNPCTEDSCDDATGCVNEPVPGVVECADGDACTIQDRCVGGECVGTPMPCLAIDACHEAGTCDPATGRCDDPRAEDGKECPGGSCLNGVCDPNASAEGGAGAGGASGDGGAASGNGGQPSANAGEPGSPGDAGGGGSPEETERPFVRDPGGCSCGVPASGGSNMAWLVGLGLAAAASRRRRRAA